MSRPDTTPILPSLSSTYDDDSPWTSSESTPSDENMHFSLPSLQKWMIATSGELYGVINFYDQKNPCKHYMSPAFTADYGTTPPSKSHEAHFSGDCPNEEEGKPRPNARYPYEVIDGSFKMDHGSGRAVVWLTVKVLGCPNSTFDRLATQTVAQFEWRQRKTGWTCVHYRAMFGSAF